MENCWEEYDKDTTLKRWGWEFTWIYYTPSCQNREQVPFTIFVCAWMAPGFLKVFKDLIQVYFAANVLFNTAVDAGKPTRESGWRRSETAGPGVGDLTLSIQSFCQRMDTVQFHLSICIFTRSNSSLSRDDLYDLQPCLGNNLTI